MKIMADAKAAEAAALGVADAQVIEAKADALEKQGLNEAKVLEMKAVAEAKGIKAKSDADAEATKKIGTAEADVIKAKAAANEEKGMVENKVLNERYAVEAKGIEEKGMAMKKLDAVGKEHEEFKLRLEKDKEIELARIRIQKDIADAQAKVIAQALQSASIDIVGGETMFFDKIIGSITQGKQLDNIVKNSEIISEIKDQFFDSSDGKNFKEKIAEFIKNSGVSSTDLKNLTISALILKLIKETKDEQNQGVLNNLLGIAKSLGISNKSASTLEVV